MQVNETSLAWSKLYIFDNYPDFDLGRYDLSSLNEFTKTNVKTNCKKKLSTDRRGKKPSLIKYTGIITLYSGK